MAGTAGIAENPDEALDAFPQAGETITLPQLSLDSSMMAATAPTKIVEPCPKCGAAMPDEAMPWCRTCGFYPKLGTYCEPDVEEHAEGAASPVKQIPQWAYVLVGGLVVMFVGSLAVRFTTHPLSALRFYWAIGQLCVGLTAFVAAHMVCFMFASTEDATIGLTDPVLRPLAIWKPSIYALPTSFRRVAIGAWGLGAALCALLIGGIPWEALTDWGDPAPRRKTSLVSAITQRAKMETAEESLEESVKDFAGQAGDVKPEEEEEKEDPTKRTHDAECVIIGYIPSASDPTDFVSLLVATDVRGRLKIVAHVSDGIPAEVHASLREQMKELKRERPFIPSRQEAVWLQPKLFCRVGFNDYNSSEKMKEPLFREMLLTPSAAE